MPKLLVISGRSVDQALVIVADDYEESAVLSQAAECGVEAPEIAAILDLDPTDGDMRDVLTATAEDRFYIG